MKNKGLKRSNREDPIAAEIAPYIGDKSIPAKRHETCPKCTIVYPPGRGIINFIEVVTNTKDENNPIKIILCKDCLIIF